MNKKDETSGFISECNVQIKGEIEIISGDFENVKWS